jgi:hypothetical protein
LPGGKTDAAEQQKNSYGCFPGLSEKSKNFYAFSTNPEDNEKHA